MNSALSQRLSLALQASRGMMRMPDSARVGLNTSFQKRYWASTRAVAFSWIAASAAAGVMPSGGNGPPNSIAVRTVAARISKNSSRLVQEMHRYFRRSSSGICGSVACASTRMLNSSCESSRLR
jgi:hypothetical protein